MALVEDGSLPPGREGPCWPRAGAGPLPPQDCGAAVPAASSVVSQPGSGFPWQPGPSLCQAVEGSLRQRLARQPDVQPFHLSQKWLCLKKCLCGGGAGQGDLGKKGAASQERSPGGPLSDHLAKAPPSGHSGAQSFFPSPEWEKGEDGLNLFTAPAAPGSGATVEVRPPEGGANNGLQVLPATAGTGDRRRGSLLVRYGDVPRPLLPCCP